MSNGNEFEKIPASSTGLHKTLETARQAAGRKQEKRDEKNGNNPNSPTPTSAPNATEPDNGAPLCGRTVVEDPKEFKRGENLFFKQGEKCPTCCDCEQGGSKIPGKCGYYKKHYGVQVSTISGMTPPISLHFVRHGKKPGDEDYEIMSINKVPTALEGADIVLSDRAGQEIIIATIPGY